MFGGDAEERSTRRRDAVVNEPKYRQERKTNELLGATGLVFCL